ncbi:C2 domain [Dillenia turbinata]|uniref:C2 domain n=1 Tax=Dillenia turbinata TaxID=194707 RepID=A0AAN8ZCR6_9MAGN
MEMSTEQETSSAGHNAAGHNTAGSVSCLLDLLRSDPTTSWSNRMTGPQIRLHSLSHESGNRFCADCGSPDPKWVSINLGVFVCIKCSGVHRSLGVHISKILSAKLDEWTEEQVNALIEMGGNEALNRKYEASIPENFTKPKPDSSIEERSDFIRRKYELRQFCESDGQLYCPYPARIQSIKFLKKNDQNYLNFLTVMSPQAGMIEFVGLIKVVIVKGTNLAIRDVMTSDPYVILSLGQQSVKTRVIKSSLNPVWNEQLMLSIPDQIPPLKLLVYDKDTFSTDDFMGQAEIDIQPLVSAAKAYENSTINESMQLGKWVASKDNTLVKDSIISLVDGKVKQDITLRLQNVERGILEMELECVPLIQ